MAGCQVAREAHLARARPWSRCPVFATGGIGGVHRVLSGAAFDESADLLELSRSSVVTVCAGAKSILDLPATVERLETLGVTVIGYRTDEFPGFLHRAHRDFALAAVAQHCRRDCRRPFAPSRALGRPGALLVVQPPPAAAALDAQPRGRGRLNSACRRRGGGNQRRRA